MKEPTSFKQDLLGASLGAFCAVMLALIPWQIDLDVPYPFYKGPVLMPLIALSLGVLASMPSCMRCIKHFNRCLKQEHFSLPRQTVCLFFAAILYPFAIWLVGLETATFCILCLLLFINGIRNIFLLLGIPAIITILFWIVFRCLLDIFFPEPLIFHMLS